MSIKLYFFSIVSLCPLILFSECGKKENMEPIKSDIVDASVVHSSVTPAERVAISYLALGDSYTKAECEVSTNSYPSKLLQKFKENEVKVLGSKIIAQTGWRTDDLKNAINSASIKDTFDIVSLLIGVNNQYQGKSAQTYRTEFGDLLETAIYYAKGRKDKVFVVSIPDYGVTPFGINNQVYISQQIDVFNAINKEVTDSMGVKYFDITPISREAATDRSLICTDGLHPSGKMYGQWVDLMWNDVLLMATKK
jgi:lysophospholipase L1-like esterase